MEKKIELRSEYILYFEDILKKIDIVVTDIKKIKIQWATNIAREAFKVIRDNIFLYNIDNIDKLEYILKLSITLLVNARPTEPMLFNWMKYILWTFYKNKNKLTISENLDILKKSFKYILDLNEQWDILRWKVWSNLIKNSYNVFTHCHSSSVIKVFKEVKNNNKKIHVYNTETRPLFQGRKTSNDIIKLWIKNSMIVDDLWPYFINKNEDTPDINLIILWCDAIKKDWSILNKVWSFWHSLSAYNSKIPVYIVWSLLKFDFENKINIEMRKWKELRKEKPNKLEVINFAFDKIPSKFVTWIITRYWVIKPNNLLKIIKKHYPWMTTNLSDFGITKEKKFLKQISVFLKNKNKNG